MSAYYSGNVEGARVFLAKDLHWTGPGAHFESADAFIRGSSTLRNLFVDTRSRKSLSTAVTFVSSLMIPRSTGATAAATTPRRRLPGSV